MKKIILLSYILILLPLSVYAFTINVPDDQPTIQAGIDASVNGDVVLLADGTYTGAGNYNIDFNGKSITVKSANGPDVCIVDCQGLGRGFLFYNGEIETSTLEGVTIKNANVIELDGGGAIYIMSSSPTFKNCIFKNNNASYGAAIRYSNSSNPSSKFLSCTFKDNCAERAGAVGIGYGNPEFYDCIFSDNSSTNNSGGAIDIYGGGNGNPKFTRCEFFSNNSSKEGGAINADRGLTVVDCLFVDNTSVQEGGAIYTFCCSFFKNNRFTGNSSSAGNGGAIYFTNNSSFSNCLFTQNSALNGGAIYCGFTHSTPVLNCSFFANQATYKGGALWCNIPLAPEDPLTLKNCILWGDSAPEGSEIYEKEKPLIITYSNIQGGHTGTGNVNEDPLFIDADTNNFHLQETSPCINTGTTDGAPSDDLDGNYRPVGNGYDMGAYEYQGPIIIDSFTANPTTGKPSLAVDFTCVAHDEINTITEYQWNFGDGNTDSTPTGTIQHTYIIPGTFSATCTVVNDNSNQTTASTIVEVTNDIPIADAGLDQIIPGNSVELDGSASSDPDGTISSWEWTLIHTENSAYNKSASGEIVYISSLEFGHYTVTLTVTDNFDAHGVDEMFLSIAGSTGDVYSQEDLDQVRLDGYDQGYLEGMDDGLNNSGNSIAGIIEEGANGEKVIEGPVIIKGTLVIE